MSYGFVIYDFITFILIDFYCVLRITAKIDNDMLKYYCNEDSFLLEVRHAEDNENMLDIILIEFIEHWGQIKHWFANE